jgi:tetratricopeptide (TPR) repeat protein
MREYPRFKAGMYAPKPLADILIDLAYPLSEQSNLIISIERSFKEMNFDALLKEAEKISKSDSKNSDRKNQEDRFLKKIVMLILEKKETSLEFNNLLALLVTTLNGGDLPNLNKREDYLLRDCGSLSQYTIIFLRALGFNVKGAAIHKHILTVVNSLIDGEDIFVDPSLGEVNSTAGSYSRTEVKGFIVLKEEHRSGMTLEKMIALQMHENEIRSAKRQPLIYFYVHEIPEHGVTGYIFANMAVHYQIAVNDYEKALQRYNKAIELDSSNAEIRIIFGGYYYQLNKIKDAMEMYTRAEELDPYNAYGLFNLGYVFCEHDNINKGLPFMKRAIALYPELINIMPSEDIVMHKIKKALSANPQTRSDI